MVRPGRDTREQLRARRTVPLTSRAWGERMLVVFVGVVAGYVAGRVLEHEIGWPNAVIVTMPAGGLLTGIAARFTLARFAPHPPPADGEQPPRGRPRSGRTGR